MKIDHILLAFLLLTPSLADANSDLKSIREECKRTRTIQEQQIAVSCLSYGYWQSKTQRINIEMPKGHPFLIYIEDCDELTEEFLTYLCKIEVIEFCRDNTVPSEMIEWHGESNAVCKSSVTND